MIKKIIALLFLLYSQIGFSQSQYPEVFSTFGGSGTVHNINMIWTGGETLCETVSNQDLTLNQGFNQLMNEIAIPKANQLFDEGKFMTNDNSKGNNLLELTVRIYPLPATEDLNIRIDSEKNEKLNLRLYNIDGSLVMEDRIENNYKLLNLVGLKDNLYVLTIFNTEGYRENFKIVLTH